MTQSESKPHSRIVSRDEWLRARQDLLAQEKALTREYDAVAAARRALPWVRITEEYVFDTLEGKKTLSELFDGRSQLIVRHFMFGPDWIEGCVGCSLASDHVGGALAHLHHRDVTYIAVSRAPLAQIESFRKRMGWTFPWVSSLENTFNYDFHVSFTREQLAKGEVFYNYRMVRASLEDLSGLSVFHKNAEGEIFHTYSTFARGDEGGLTTYFYLDLTPKGRGENERGNLGDWVRHHDRYDVDGNSNGPERDPAQLPSAAVGNMRPQASSPSSDRPPRIAIKTNRTISFIDPHEVVAVHAEGNYVMLQRESGTFLLRESITSIGEKLKPFGFLRIHRSVLLNSTFIEEIRARMTGEYDIRIKGGKKYTASRTYKNNLKSLTNFLIGSESSRAR